MGGEGGGGGPASTAPPLHSYRTATIGAQAATRHPLADGYTGADRSLP